MEFASRLGIANGSVSKIENGRMTVSDDLLDRIAVALDCTPEYLAAPERIGPTTRPWLRAYADASKRTVDQQAADSATVIEVSDILGLRRIPDGIPIFDDDPSDDEAIEQFALDVRAAAQIGDGDVVGNCIRAAERLGCVVLPMRNELGKHLGLSLRSNMIPVICVSQASTNRPGGVPGDRQRFTVAHELGHLGLHAGLGPPESADDANSSRKASASLCWSVSWSGRCFTSRPAPGGWSCHPPNAHGLEGALGYIDQGAGHAFPRTGGHRR